MPVGTPLARIRSEQEAKAGVAAGAAIAEVRRQAQFRSRLRRARCRLRPSRKSSLPVGRGRVRASPAARRLASARGIDLRAITGSGPLGAIILCDVERSGGATAPPVERKRTIGLDLDAMRAAIAAAMARSKREIPHYYLRASGRRDGMRSNFFHGSMPRARRITGCSWAPCWSRPSHWPPAAFRRSTASIRTEQFKPSPAIHVGVAIAIRGGGLAAPAIHDSDQLTLDELMARMRDLVQRMRAGRIRSSEMADPTITVSSLGERGVEALYGIIYPPQVAIVGFGKVVARPWIVDGSVVPRSVVTITLAARSSGQRRSCRRIVPR